MPNNIDLSCDILFCILSRLPVKSLLRFQSVSKPWNAMISDEVFKKAHHYQSEVLGRVKFLLQVYCGDEFELINLENQRVISIEKQRFPLKGFERAHVLCAHDGLILLKKRRAYKTFILWNASTRQYQKLAPCPYLNKYALPRTCGLCYDSTADDYKVILIYTSFYVVYSMNREFWTMKTTLPVLGQRHHTSLERVINAQYIWRQGINTTEGCVYWCLNRTALNQFVSGGSSIICFDVKSDELKELPAPDFVGPSNDELFCLTILKGHLCLYGGKDILELDIWIMKEDGWKWLMKLHDVPSREFHKHYFIKNSRILCCAENGEIIFQGPKNSQVSIYNPKQQKIVGKDFISNYNPMGYECAVLYPTCLDSLYFPKLINVKHKRKRRI